MRLNNSDWDRVLRSALSQPGVVDRSSLIGTDAFDWTHWGTAEWSAADAFRVLGVRLLPFPEEYIGRIAGFASLEGIALDQRAKRKVNVAAHELAHWFLRHNDIELRDGIEPLRRPIFEVEAECTALLVGYALDTGGLEHSRAYVQYFIRQPTVGPLPTSWEHVKKAALTILMAGRRSGAVPSMHRPKAVVTYPSFASRISWHS